MPDTLQTSRDPFIVPIEKIRDVATWVSSGRGLRRWVSAELGTMRPDILTPGDSPSPHWAYPIADSVEASPTEVIGEEIIPVPTERMRLRFKRHWTGVVELYDSGRAKADKHAKELGTGVEWDIEFCEFGLAHLHFFRRRRVPLVEWMELASH